MFEAVQGVLADYYMEIKFVHIVAVMIWLFSTAVAFAYYHVPIFKIWRDNPSDPDVREMRNWVMERFDHGVVLEHIAFPVIMITGPILYLLSGYDSSDDWFLAKMLIVFGFFVPVEIFDYYISHLGGSKKHIRLSGNDARYEGFMALHWNFFVFISLPIALAGLTVVYLAVTKPVFGS